METLPCPLAAAARVLGDKWTLIILRDLLDGPCRFTDLERSGEGISPSILSARLRDLERQGLLNRASFRELPPRVEYSLTMKGQDATRIINALRAYGERWLIEDSLDTPLPQLAAL